VKQYKLEDAEEYQKTLDQHYLVWPIFFTLLEGSLIIKSNRHAPSLMLHYHPGWHQ